MLEGNLLYLEASQEYRLREALHEGCYENQQRFYSSSHNSFLMIWVGILTVCSTHGAPQEVTVNVLYIQ